MPASAVRALLSTCLFASGAWLLAQTPIHRRYTMDDGLPSNTVYAVVQDHEGYIWFSTDAGVSRFDGRAFVNFDREQGLPDDDILNIFEDSRHRMWFLGFNGRLGYYHEGRFHNPSNNEDLARFRCPSGFQSVVEDAEGMIWFGGVRNDVLRIDPEGDRDRYWSQAPRPVSIGLDEEGRILLLRSATIHRLEQDEWVPTDSLDQFFHNIFLRPVPDHDNGLVALTGRGLMRIRQHRWETWVEHQGLDAEQHQSCWIDAYGTVWVRRWRRGVEQWSPGLHGPLPRPKLLFPKETINYVYADRDHNLWFTTPRNGVLFCQTGQERTALYLPPPGSVEGGLLSLLRDEEGVIWCGSEAGQIFRFDGQGLVPVPVREGDRGMGRVRNMVLDQQGKLVVGGDYGVFRWVGGPGGFDPLRSAIAPRVILSAKDVDRDREGQVWAASFGLYQHAGPWPSDTVKLVDTSVGIQRVHHVACDPSGAVWFSTLGELYVLENGVDRRVPLPDIRPDSRISDLTFGPDGTLFVATMDNGIHVLKDGVVHGVLDRRNGLVSDRVERVRCNGDTLVLCTGRGVQVVVYRNEEVRASWDLGAASVLATDQVNDAFLHGGTLYTATSSGLSAVQFPSEPQRPFLPVLRLASIMVNGLRLPPRAEVLVAAGDRVGVVVHPIDYSAQRRMEYQYRLDGHAPWAQAESGTMEFAGIEKGTHLLQMRVRRPEGVWSSPVEVKVVAVPPWWDSTWWKVAVGLLLVTGIVVLVRSIITRRYRRALALERQRAVLNEERRRISADVHDDLGAELSNALMHVRNAARNAAAPEVRAPIDAAAGKVAGTIARIDEIIWSLDPHRDNLRATVHFIEQQAGDQLAAHGIRFRTEVAVSEEDVPLSANQRREIWLIVREALRNVVKHARATTVTIAWSNDGSGTGLMIEDDGEGLPDGAEHTGRHGIGNMRLRASRIGATLQVGPRPGGGTRIEVRLPPREGA